MKKKFCLNVFLLTFLFVYQLAFCQHDDNNKLSSIAWLSISDIYDDIIKHPFHQELTNGTLDRQKFAYYVEQDIRYVEADAMNQALIARNMTSNGTYFDYYRKQVRSYLEYANSEQDLFLASQYSPKNQMTPTYINYISHLVNICSNKPYQVAVAAMLPCLWIYNKVGGYIANHTVPNNVYKAWIDLIYGDGSGQVASIDIFDQLAQNASESMRHEMLAVFRQSAKFEYHFWDDAYYMRSLADDNSNSISA